MKSSESSYSKLFSEESVKKYVLPYYDLGFAKVQQVKFKNSKKQRAVYKVINNNKAYCLKKIYYNASELLFIYSAIEWWHRNGINVPRILPTNTGSRFVNFKGMLFILTPWIDGEKCNYDNEYHFLTTAKNLGEMHCVSKNFIPIQGSNVKEESSVLYSSFNKHFSSLLNYSNSAYKTKDSYSQIFLSSFDKIAELSQLGSYVSSTINSHSLTKNLCHLDYVNKNIIFDKNNEIWVIDFDNCKIGYASHDISHCLRRYLKRTSTLWDLEITEKWLYKYNLENRLTIDDYKYIAAYLIFPQKIWKITRDYYRNIKKCNKRAFCSLLDSSTAHLDEHIEFSYSFIKYIEGKFASKIY